MDKVKKCLKPRVDDRQQFLQPGQWKPTDIQHDQMSKGHINATRLCDIQS